MQDQIAGAYKRQTRRADAWRDQRATACTGQDKTIGAVERTRTCAKALNFHDPILTTRPVEEPRAGH
jgi:hypothetical protein